MISTNAADPKLAYPLLAVLLAASTLLPPAPAIAAEEDTPTDPDTQLVEDVRLDDASLVSPPDRPIAPSCEQSPSIAHLLNRAAEYTLDATSELARVQRAAQERLDRIECLVNTALAQVGACYASGGMAPGAFDCSGLVKYAFENALGMELPRTSYAQAALGEEVALADAQRGDLVFWGSRSSSYHVGICLGDGQYVHAANPRKGVRVDSFDYYCPTFAKRIL